MAEDRTGIYQIFCSGNRQLYVGSSTRIYRRWSEHRKIMRRNKHTCTYLQNSWNRYGEETFIFTVLEDCPRETLLVREQHYIDMLKPALNVMKIVDRWTPTPEMRAKLIASTKARAAARTHCPHGHAYTPDNLVGGKKLCATCNSERVSRRYHSMTPEQKAVALVKMRERYHAKSAELGRVKKWSPEYLAKLRAANKGRAPSMAAREATRARWAKFRAEREAT